MDIKHIGFDIDGTLIDELSYCVEFFLEKYHEVYQKKYNGLIDTTKYALRDRFPDCEKEFWDTYEDAYWEDYIKNAPFRPYVKELFEKLKQAGAAIHIVTARTAHGNKTYDDVVAYTKERFERENIPVDEYHIGFNEKDSIVSGNGIEILVEDSPEQILKVSEKIPVFVMNCAYNTLIRGKNIWRIATFEPKQFLENAKYAKDHEDNWDIEYSSNKEKDEAGSINFKISENGTICFNPDNFGKRNITFIIPFGNGTNDSFAQKITRRLKDTTIIRLNLIETDLDTINPETDELLYAMMKKYNPGKVDLTDPNETKGYIIKCKIMTELLKEASSRKKKSFIFFGVQSMMLKRDVTEKYKDYPIFIIGASEKEHKIVVNGKYRKDYNPWILMEDLTEVATQIRKWKIIAGTAPKELPEYINRQTTTSDGVDIVHLLPGEKPYQEDELRAALSEDTYLLGDCHLSIKDPEKTKRILAAINRTVNSDDHLLFLGDFDGKKGTGSYELTKDFIKKLKCKNVYLILGNNDPYTIDDYAKMGFKTVTDMISYQESPEREIILTHCAYPVERDQINIHGHIHGSRCYWNMDWHQHYDVWDEDFVPIKIRDCIKILENDMYVAHSENHLVH